MLCFIEKWNNSEDTLSIGPHIRNVFKEKMAVVVITVIFKVPVKHTCLPRKDSFIPRMGELTRYVRLAVRILAG